MPRFFLITVDTEADNQWDTSSGANTENVQFLPRFQELAEKYGFVPTWLTNYEIAMDDRFVHYMKPKNDSGACEIGMHLHAWSNPPEFPLEVLTDQRSYLIEYEDEAMRAKVEKLLNLLREKFDAPITSHRSGRWALDGRYVELLADKGFIVDCSVTPHIDWSMARGQTGKPGTDYSAAPERPYFIAQGLLEVPVTIRKTHRFALDALRESRDVLRQAKRLVKGQWQWLRPQKNPTVSSLCSLLRSEARSDSNYAMFMIHSSELMPGGSPSFPDEESVEHLYSVIEEVFACALELGYVGCGMTDYAKRWLAES